MAQKVQDALVLASVVSVSVLALALAACPPPPKPVVGPPPPGPCTRVAPAPAPEAPAPPRPPAAADDEGRVLVLRGTPGVPAALRRRLGRYLDARYAQLFDLSDHGESVLVGTRFGRTRQLHLVNRPLGMRRQLTFKDEPIRRATFVPQTRQVLYMADVGGDEQYQIFNLDLRSGKTRLLTDGTSRHGPYLWSHAGKRIAYTSNARNGRDMDLYIGDGRTRSGRLLLERRGHWTPVDWSHDGKQLLVARYVSINDVRLFTVELASKKVTRVSPVKPTASYRAAVFSKNGRRLYVATDREGEFVELYELDLKKGDWKPLTRGIKWNVEQIALAPDGRELAFTVNEDGYSVPWILDLRTRRARRIASPKLPRGLIRGLSYARRAKVLGFTLVTPTTTGDVYTFRRWRGLTRWTESELGGLDARRLIKPRLLRYKTFDGRRIPAFYYRPPGKGPFPVVVAIHGGPESQARPTFSAFIQYLVNESGVAVLVPNVRGSDGYGKSYLLLDNGFKREDSVRDIGALLDWLGRQKELDAGRVGVFGGSYGGYMVLASLVHFADRIAAGVNIVGISNFVTFLKNTRAYRRDLRRAEYGDERKPRMHAFLQRISPSRSAEKIKSALFVAHGANDPRVPLSETDQLVEAVRKQGQDVWTMVARNEGHGFHKKDNRDLFYQLSVLFFEKHLGEKGR